MPTNTTIAAARAQLVQVIATGALATVDGKPKVFYAWPGSQLETGAHEVVFVERVRDWRQSITGIKAGRKQREESYTFDLALWVSQPDTGADGAQACFERAIDLMKPIEDALADDVTMGLPNGNQIHLAQLTEREPRLIPHEQGWAAFVTMSVDASARLT